MSLEKIKIKKLAFNDTDLILRASIIHLLSWKKAYSEIVPKSYLDNLKEDHWVKYFVEGLLCKNIEVALIFENDIPVGVITYGKSEHEGMESYGEIRSLYIHPDFYSKCYGKKLIDYALNEIKSFGLSGACLFAFENNYGAKKFYERLGFKCNGVKDSFEIDGTTLYDVLYVKEL